jgi:hypothetical protein
LKITQKILVTRVFPRALSFNPSVLEMYFGKFSRWREKFIKKRKRARAKIDV